MTPELHSKEKVKERQVLGPEGKGHLISENDENEYILEVKNELIQVGDDFYQIDYETKEGAAKVEVPDPMLPHDETLSDLLAFASPDRPEQRIPTEESPSQNFDFSKKQAQLPFADEGKKEMPGAEVQPLPQAYRYQPSGDYSMFLKDHKIDWNKIEKKPKPKPEPIIWEGRGIKFGRHFRNKSTFHFSKTQPVL